MTRAQLTRQARKNADLYEPDKPLSWRDALAAGEESAAALKADEGERSAYAEAFAKRLVKRGLARPKGVKVSGPGGANLVPQRAFRAPDDVFDAIGKAAKKAGMNRNEWILAAVAEKLARG